MSDAPKASSDPMLKGDDLVWAIREESHRLRRLKHRPPNKLPVRPSLEYYRDQARDLLKTLRAQDPSVELHTAQHNVARGVGQASWRKLVAAISARERAASELDAALNQSDQRAVARVVRDHPDALLDVGATASPNRLARLIELAPVSRFDSVLCTALLDAVAEHHQPEGLDECLRMLLDWTDADPLYANDVIQDRQARAEASPTGVRATEMFDDALGYLAWFVDEPDYSEYLSESD